MLAQVTSFALPLEEPSPEPRTTTTATATTTATTTASSSSGGGGRGRGGSAECESPAATPCVEPKNDKSYAQPVLIAQVPV